MSDSATMLQSIGGRFLVATHQHEARIDEARPWLLRREPSCQVCDELRAALTLELVS